MSFDNNFSPKLRPFMIVSAPYVDLEGNIKTFNNGDTQKGLFMVARVDENNNVLAFKITSQRSKFINDFTYLISFRSHPFLRTDSFVQLDKWHTLAASECSIIGAIIPSLRMAILRKFDLIMRTVDNCLKNNMSWEDTRYVSPNKVSATPSITEVARVNAYSRFNKDSQPIPNTKFVPESVDNTTLLKRKEERLDYLLRKEKVCNLDKRELLELIKLEKELGVYSK